MTTERIYQFLAVVNGVTAFHRHDGKVPKRKLDSLSNMQIDIENELSEEKEIIFNDFTKKFQKAILKCSQKEEIEGAFRKRYINLDELLKEMGIEESIPF